MSMGMTLEFQVETENSIFLSLAFKSSSAEFNDASYSLLFEYNKVTGNLIYNFTFSTKIIYVV